MGTRAASSLPVVLESSGTGSSTVTDQHIDDPGMKCMPPPSPHIQCVNIIIIHTIGSEGQSNPATPGGDSDQVDGDDGTTGDTTSGIYFISMH